MMWPAMSEASSAYRRAGVDIDKKYAAVGNATAAIRSTFTAGVRGDVGSFGGIFDLAAVGAAGELLVASTDGVGTKVKVAQLRARAGGPVGTVGEDLVNHCVNDILVQGARPLFFLDYIAMSTMLPAQVTEIIGGLAKACRENGCALLGGETAEMPGVYRDGEIDVAGTIIGAVPRDRVLDGSAIAVGDVLLGLPSTGLHTNGFSLARQVLFSDAGLQLDDRPDELGGSSVGDALLAVHRSYLGPVLPLLEQGLLRGLAHITGGGLPDNLPRVLPPGTAARIDTAAIPRSPICDLIVARGGVARAEAYRVLNMGVGLVLVAAPDAAAAVQAGLEAAGERPFRLGEIVAGERSVELR
ncbi:MAG: phosphoribosylformylglycinamidine cyclo-ligase [Planctomycetes bacterium]|nr:phosphoribosylformylglycinamidine cyclo-ligase [Planctomycetota bacterium]